MRARPARPTSGGLLEHQKRAAERLRREVLSADGSLQHSYFRSLTRQLRDYRSVVTREELFAAAARADIVYVGDFHARAEFQRFAADLLESMARRPERLALGVEFVYTRQQRLLDRRQAGTLSDEEFLRRLHYREEWGYPWDGYRDLLDRARDLGVPVHALDVAPRGGFDGLLRRDEHAARRIEALLADDPRSRLIVLFGESHLARSRMPRRTRKRLARSGLERSALMVFQSPDRIHWQLVAGEAARPEAVQVDESTFAVFHVSPLEKYESYRQVLERWRGDLLPDEEVDLTPAAHHLIGVLLSWIGIRAPYRRVRHRAGWSEDLVDTFPEVYSGDEATGLLGSILQEHGRTAVEIREARRELGARGALYDARSNTMFLSSYRPAAAAGAGARFLRAALTGRLFIAGDQFQGHPAASAYGAAYVEALALLGARLVDPTADDPLSTARRPAADARRWLEEHERFERSRRAEPPEELRLALRRSRPMRRLLARELGRRLGLSLFRRVREGSLSRRAVRRLFTDPLTADRAARRVIRLLRGRGSATAQRG